MEHESDVYTNCNWCYWYSHQRIVTGTGGLRNNRTSWDYPNYNIIKISKNTAKSPGDLKRLDVTQTPVKDHQLTLMWKTLWEQNNNNTQKVKGSLNIWRLTYTIKLNCILQVIFWFSFKFCTVCLCIHKFWVSWSTGVPLIANMGDLIDILLAVFWGFFQVHKRHTKQPLKSETVM